MEYPRFTSSERTPTQENISREKKEVGAKLTGRLYLLLAAKINGGDAPLTTVPEEWINAPGQSYDIHIQGDEAFTQRTKEAFEVLRANAADFHTFVKQNIGIIQQVKRGSRMDASELIPVFFAGDNGSQGGKKWYAG